MHSCGVLRSQDAALRQTRSVSVQQRVKDLAASSCVSRLSVMRLPKRRISLFVLAAIIVIVAWGFFFGPSSADIRLDTGDLRYRYLGIPLVYERMPEPHRSRLLSLARESSALEAEWHQCADYPLPTTNHTDRMCRVFYYKIEAWIREDRIIALSAAEDVAEYIRTTNAKHSLPESVALLKHGDWNDDGDYTVRGDWRDDDDLRSYLKMRGLDVQTHKRAINLTGQATGVQASPE